MTRVRLSVAASQRTIAENAGWTSKDGKPQPAKVHRLLKSLRTNKLVKQWRGKWIITELGKAEIEASQE